MTKKHVKNIYGDDGKIMFKQYRIDGKDYLENSDGVSISLDKLRKDVEAFVMKGVHVLHPGQMLEIVDTRTDDPVATVSTSETVFTTDGIPMTEVNMLAEGYGVNVLDDEDYEEDDDKTPYDFRLVDRDNSVWLEWYDDDLIDHGVDVYSLAALIEDIWYKKNAKEGNHE